MYPVYFTGGGRGWRRRRSWIQAALAFSDSILAGRGLPAELVYVLVPDLIAATEFNQSSFGLALVLFGYAL